MSTITQPTSSNTKNFYGNQLIPGTADKVPGEEGISGAEPSGTKGRQAAGLLIDTMLNIAPTFSPSPLHQQMSSASEAAYNDIPSEPVESWHGNNSDIQTVQQLRTALSSPEAEAASNAATLMLLFISLMGDFQKAKANAITSGLDSMLSKMSTQIQEMENEKNATFNREMVSFGGELLVSGTSLVVSIVGARTLEATRSELLKKQNDLSMAREYESLVKNNESGNNRSNEITAHFNKDRSKKYADTKNPAANGQNQVPKSEVIKENIELHQTQIASFEARHQLINNIAALCKNMFVCTAAVLNKDATQAKINETQAGQGKEVINIKMQLDRDSTSFARETIIKFLVIVEKMLEANSEMTKTIARK